MTSSVSWVQDLSGWHSSLSRPSTRFALFFLGALREVILMSEGLDVLHFIHSRGGCMLTELSTEMGIPMSSIHGWVSLLCSTGYLKRCEQDHGYCPCESSGKRCVACRCSCSSSQSGTPIRIEVTERGMAMVRRRSDETEDREIIKNDGRLPRSNLHYQ